MTRRAALAIAADSAAEPVRVATYSRISTDEERQPNSLEAQRVRLEAFVESQPEWRIERRYEDQFTGTVIDRPALTRLLRDAKLDRFDVLLVYRVDRLARSIRGLAQVIDELDQAGVIFRSATEPFDTGTPAGRMMVQMLGVFAEFERALIVERITAGLERKAARGGWCGGRRPYGLDIAPDRDHLQRNPTEAPLIPVIFDRYVNGQEGSSMLAKWLNESGYRTKNGRPWSATSVLTVLRNRSYLGEIYYRGSWYPAPHEPLIPTELFDRAQAILTKRGEDRSQRRTNASDYLLTGRVRCGRCGQAYIGTAAHGRNGRYTYYTCFTRMRYGTKHCANDRLPAERLEQAVTRRLWKVLEDGDLINSAIEQTYARLTERTDEQTSEHAAVQRKLTETRAAMDRYFRAFENATMPEDTCAPRLAALSEQAKALEGRAAELAAAADDTEHPERVTPADLDALRRELRAALEHSTPARTKTVLQAMIDTIRVDARDHIEPTFRIPAVREPCGSMDSGGRRLNRKARVEALRQALAACAANGRGGA
ncbi:MAG TPA: recombinase family protein [Solirubrobacteraceae bacterium]|jgi:site-specific DNA recombinase|nr:recombinase family protein [Solirubrobacteraceae bacterium]